jgi:hypothetical protein
VYSDKIIFWNEGRLPENWTISQLKEKHPSKPFNPVIANVFFRAGLIEAWGGGIERCSGPMEPQTETCKTKGRLLGQEIYPLYFYPFPLKAVLGKNARFPG